MPMQTRTDQVHSYEFFLQRVVSGLVARESDPAELPFRRLGWSGFGSIMIAVLVAGIVAVVGIFVGGGNDRWRDGDSIIQERGSEGSVYIYRSDTGILHPVVNLTSAKLIMNGADVIRVSARSLEGVRRGVTLGIAGAPESLPSDSDDLLTDPWALCSQQQPDGRGGSDTISVLGVGQNPAGGAVVAGDQSVLVRDTEGDALHLVWNGYRFLIPSQVDATLDALGVSAGQALPGSPAWLDALPQGDPLTTPPAGEPGQPTEAFDDPDVLTGDVISDVDRFYLVTSDELVELTSLQADILDRAGANTVDRTVPANAPTRDLPPATATSPPATAPGPVSLGGADERSVCSVFQPGEFTPAVLVGGELEPRSETERVAQEGTGLADFVVIEGGKAVLVQSLSAPGAAVGPWHIVNDQGIRFSIPSPDVAGAFGYPIDRGVQMSGGLVDLLPSGPALDPAAADDPAVAAAP